MAVVRAEGSVNPELVVGRTFGYGNGSRVLFNLSGGDPFRARIHPILYKIDWFGVQQLYNTARTNLALRSQDFSTVWAPVQVTPTTGVAAPDGTTTATTFTDNNTLSAHFIPQAGVVFGSGVHVISIFAKAGTRKIIMLREGSITGASSSFNLETGVVVANAAGGTGAIAPVVGAPGWYRCSMSCTPTAGARQIEIYMLQDAGSVYADRVYQEAVGKTVSLWGAQGEATVLTPYIVTVAAAVTVTDYSTDSAGKVTFASAPAIGTQLTYKDPWATNVYRHFGLGDGSATQFSLPFAPRDPFVLANGVLQGNGTATNLVIRSQDFSTGWSLINAPTRVSAALVYSGLTLDLLSDDSAAVVKGFFQVITLTGDGVKSLSFYLSKGTSTTTMIRLLDATASANRILASVTWEGTAPSVSMLAGTLVGIEPIGAGVYRVLTTGTGFVAANTHQLFVYPATSTAGFLVGDTGNVLLGGFQVENGPQPTPYIPTTTVAKTGDLTVAPNGDVTTVVAPADGVVMTATFALGPPR